MKRVFVLLLVSVILISSCSHSVSTISKVRDTVGTTLKKVKTESNGYYNGSQNKNLKSTLFAGNTKILAQSQMQVSCIAFSSCNNQPGKYPGVCRGLLIPNKAIVSSLLSPYVVPSQDAQLIGPLYIKTLDKLPLTSTNKLNVVLTFQELCRLFNPIYYSFPGVKYCPGSIGNGLKIVMLYNSYEVVTFTLYTDGCTFASMSDSVGKYGANGAVISDLTALAALINVPVTGLS